MPHAAGYGAAVAARTGTFRAGGVLAGCPRPLLLESKSRTAFRMDRARAVPVSALGSVAATAAVAIPVEQEQRDVLRRGLADAVCGAALSGRVWHHDRRHQRPRVGCDDIYRR